MNIDIENARKILKKYIEKYDIKNSRIQIKANHIYRVAENSKKIAQNIGLEEEQVKLAELIGLLHDIGRFEQIKKYNTFADRMSEDHAELGIKVLLEDNFLNEFLEDKTEQEILIKAIRNHNKYKIQEKLNEQELLHAKIIRDADKLDIFKIIIKANIEDTSWFKSKNIEEEKLNEKMYEDFINKKPILYENMKNSVDQIVTWIAYIYDLNFPISLKIVKDNEYINKLVQKINYKDELTKERMEQIRKQANEYIKSQI